jgi:outer membrane protein insertion porin family
MRNGALLLALVACIAVGGHAQAEEAQWYLDKPIRDFVFTGLRTISAAELRPVVRPYIGKPFTIELYEEVRAKLYALDYFELIEGTANPGDEAKTVVIVELAVVERPTVASVEVRGNVGVRTPAIMDKILIKKGDMASEPLVDVDKETIRKLR